MNRQAIIRNIVLFFLFLIPFFALIVSNSYFFPFISGKAFYFRILVEIAFAGWVILAFLDPRYRPKISPISIGVTVFALVILVADLLGVNPMRSLWSNFERMEGWLTIVHLWAFLMAVVGVFGSSDLGRRIWYRWFNISLIAATIVAIYGLVQLFGGAAIHQGSTRIDASLGNAAYMAVYMLFHVFISGYMFVVARRKEIYGSNILVWVYPVLAVFFAFLVFETQTRGTIIGLIGGIVVALGLYVIFGKNETKSKRSVAFGAIVLIFILGAIFWANRSSSFVTGNELLNRLATISWNDTKTQARGYVWPMALSGASERPILGWGQENFNYIFNAKYNSHMWNQEQWFDRAHSVFLDWLVAGGVLGLASYIGLYILFLVTVWRSSLTVAEKSVLTGLVAAYGVHNIFVFDNISSYIMFFAILAFGDSLGQKQNRRLFGGLSVNRDMTNYVVTPAVIVFLISAIYYFDVRMIQAGSRLIQAMRLCASGKADTAYFESALNVNVYTSKQEIREQLLSCAPTVINGAYAAETKQAFFDLGMRELEAQIADTPNDTRIYVIGGTFLNNINQFGLAEKFLTKALQLSPNKQTIAFQLATDFINTGKIDQAVVILKKAYEDAPEYGEARSAYAIALISSGRSAEAKTIFADEPEILENDRAADGYALAKQYPASIALYKVLISRDPTNVELQARLARVQYLAGLIFEAIQTLTKIKESHPELGPQIDAAIEEIRKGS